jgi:uncharacterized membrane protein YphA (DoxX/SURF4 family)
MSTKRNEDIMARNYLPAAARVLLGVVMLLTGVNKLFWFVPMPHMSPALTAFMDALKQTGYYLPFIGIVEATGGALLLVNRLVPLAITILAPVLVNILGVHTFLDTSGFPLALILIALDVYLAWVNRDAFRPMFVGRGVKVSRIAEPEGLKRALP